MELPQVIMMELDVMLWRAVDEVGLGFAGGIRDDVGDGTEAGGEEAVRKGGMTNIIVIHIAEVRTKTKAYPKILK